MLEALLDSTVKEKVLLFLYTHGQAYPREVAAAFGLYINSVQYQMLKLEAGGILFSRLRGKVRLFELDPRYPFKRELEALLEKALKFYPAKDLDRYFRPRRRPRRTGKPLPE